MKKESFYDDVLKKLLTILLRETQKKSHVNKSVILREIRNLKLLNTIILKLVNEELVEINNEEIRIVNKRVPIAVKCIEYGVREYEISKYLSWKEFEYFVKNIFESFNYKTYANVHIKFMNRRCEVDIIAFSGRCVFIIDVKHWLKPLGLMRAERISELQHKRSVVFMRKNPFKDFDYEYIVPIIVTLVSQKFLKTKFSIIMPVTCLNNFILEFEKHIDEVPYIRREKVESSCRL